MLRLRKVIAETPPHRLPEVDVIRGVAVVLMIGYHSWLLSRWMDGGFGSIDPLIRLAAVGIPILFLGLVGLSLHLVSVRVSLADFAIHIFKKSGMLVVASALVTVLTWLLMPALTVYFGIIHLILVSTLLAGWLVIQEVSNRMMLGIALLVIGIGLAFQGAAAGWWWTLPFGLPPLGFASLDYFPLFPWVGVVLLGVVLGRKLYPKGKPRGVLIALHDLSASLIFWPLVWCGRNSLLIYLLHVPIIWLIITSWGMISAWH